MKISRVLVLCTIMFGAAVLATAQSNLRVNVPFDFHVGSRVLPAGAYTVGRVFDRDPNLFALTGTQSRTRVTVLALDSRGKAGSGLSFRHHGEMYLLSAISTPAGRFVISSQAGKSPSDSVDTEVDVTAASK